MRKSKLVATQLNLLRHLSNLLPTEHSSFALGSLEPLAPCILVQISGALCILHMTTGPGPKFTKLHLHLHLSLGLGYEATK